MAMEIRRKKLVEVEETLVVPDHYSEDDSVRGVIVDALLRNAGSRRNRGAVRNDLFEEELLIIRSAIESLETAYAHAEAILTALKARGVLKDDHDQNQTAHQ